MKKSIILMLFMCMFIFTPMVEAECKYGYPSPEISTNGSWRRDDTITLNTTADSCYGSNAKVYFSAGSYLPMGRFYIHAVLYEEDVLNADDKVKTYRGYNNGYNVISWELMEVNNSGKIDSDGDQTCELYMNFRIEDVENGPIRIMRLDLFKYSLCI